MSHHLGVEKNNSVESVCLETNIVATRPCDVLRSQDDHRDSGDRCQFDQVASKVQSRSTGGIYTSCGRTESTRCQPASLRSATLPLAPSDAPEAPKSRTQLSRASQFVTINVSVIAPADHDMPHDRDSQQVVTVNSSQ